MARRGLGASERRFATQFQGNPEVGKLLQEDVNVTKGDFQDIKVLQGEER